MSAPDRETPYLRGAFEHALAVVQASSDPVERVQASHVAHLLSFAVFPLNLEERLATDVMSLLGLRLAEADVVAHLLGVLRRRAPDLRRLAHGVERLADRAHREQFRESLSQLVSEMLATRTWRSHVRGEWAANAVELSLAEGNMGESLDIVRRWLDQHDFVPGWLREVVETHPQLLEGAFSGATRWQLHCSAPTAHAWRWLVDHPHDKQMLDPKSFGGQLGQAIETLQAAMAAEPNDARRVVLANWLAEIAG